MALRLDENDTDSKLNPGQTDSDQKFNRIAQAETDREFDSMVDDPVSGLGDVEKSAATGGLNQSQSLADQEGGSTGFSSSFSGKSNRNTKKGGFSLRRSGPIGAILGILGVGGFGLATLFSPSLLLVHIEESFVNKFNTQDTSFTIRTNKIIAKKLTSDVTSGVCGSSGVPVTVLCKFQRPSNKLLSNLNKNGIKAIGADGEIKPTKLGWPNERPVSFEFTDSAGKTISVEAKDFYKTLNSNSDFRAAVHKAFNTRFMGFADFIFDKIKLRFNFHTSNDLGKAPTEADVADNLGKEVAGAESGVNKAANGVAESADTAIANELEPVVEKEVSTLKQTASKANNAVILGAGLACMTTEFPQLVIDAERAYQLPQLIKLAAAFLTTAGAIKAGDATPQETAALGDAITKVVENKSAMDSFGMKYSLFNDVASKDNTSYQTFIPGGGAIKTFGSTAKIAQNPAVKVTCDTVNNPLTGPAVDGILALTGIGEFANVAVGALMSVAITQLSGPLVNGAVSLLSSTGILNDIMQSFFGDLTQNALKDGGQGLGDALASGASNLMGQTANAGYNMPLTVDQAVAYNQTTKQVQLAYAQEDQATLSPFDATNSNTFLGSLFNKLMPFATQTGSFGGVLSSIADVVASIPSGLFPSAYAADPAAQFTGCVDPSLASDGSGNSIAVGPFCNIQYGIPPQYLDRDPVDVLNSLISSGQVDPHTGDPVNNSGLSDWVNTCTDGTASSAKGCVINDQTANYALYMIDHRVQADLDGETINDGSNNGNVGTNSTTNTNLSSSQLYQSSVNTVCASGTNDAGTAQGYYNGQEIDIRLCSIPGTTDSGNSGQPIEVNSVMSANFLSLTQAMGQALGSPVKAASSFRTMAGQQAAYASYGSSRAAKPGFSNHQMGLAVDFQLVTGNNGATKPAGSDRVYDWLTANAATYGIAKISTEAWHWQAAGAN